MPNFELPFREGSLQYVLLERLRSLHDQLDDQQRGTPEYLGLTKQIRELGDELNRLQQPDTNSLSS